MSLLSLCSVFCRCYLSVGEVAAGVDRNFVRHWSLQKKNVLPSRRRGEQSLRPLSSADRILGRGCRVLHGHTLQLSSWLGVLHSFVAGVFAIGSLDTASFQDMANGARNHQFFVPCESLGRPPGWSARKSRHHSLRCAALRVRFQEMQDHCKSAHGLDARSRRYRRQTPTCPVRPIAAANDPIHFLTW